MGRLNQPEPSPWTPPEQRRKYWREPGEPVDGRPLIWRRPFWASPEEESAYLSAVRNNPRREDEGAFAYIVRIAETVQRGPLPPAVKAMPEPERLKRDYTGPRPTVTEGGLSFEDRLDAIYSEREPGSDDE